MYRILIVDDEHIERNGIKLLINMYKFPLEVLEAENGEKAMEFLISEHIDILFTDIKMPFMDGLELSAKAREYDPDIKIIIFSAYGEFEYARKAIKSSVSSYILKPIDVEEFQSVMIDILKEFDEERKQEQHYSEITCETADETGKKAIGIVLAIIESEYMKDISLEYLADKVYLTPGYLSYLFKKETGQSFVKFLTNYRLKKACDLLDNTNMKIVDICAGVGYSNISYFCMIFRNNYGVSPAKFRERGESPENLL